MNDASEHKDEPQEPQQAEPSPPPEGVEKVEPFSAEELRLALLRPHRIIECVLGGKERLAANLTAGQALWWLVLLLLAASLLSALPYGALSPTRSFWKIAVLYTGSLLLCFPCLHAFAEFLGLKLGLGRAFALSLVIPSVAGLFTFGFFPIIWFIDFTTQARVGAAVVPEDLSVFLLAVSLLMGVVQMGRCLLLRGGLAKDQNALSLLIVCWLPLLLFITYRMATLLGVL